MKNPKPFHKRIALILLAIFLPSLLPVNLLYASNNGPKAPEAASFEPVDATDMVNLVTGQYSYVLPLLNVPSPEGGYPLALSYHAGIGLDQQASWTGLGWNLNPGAINRNINGYPDDYRDSALNEFFYDSGATETISFVSVGYSNAGLSIGTTFNWGTNQALGGSVSIGYGAKQEGYGGVGGGVTIGTNGASVGLNATLKGGLSLGVQASSNGNISGNIGFDSNGGGFSISSDGSFSIDASISKGNNISISGSSSSIGVSLKAKTKQMEKSSGIGAKISFNNTVSMGDYSTSQAGWQAGLFLPTNIGVFSLSFGKQEFTYWLNKRSVNRVTGPLNFNSRYYKVDWYDPNSLIIPPPQNRGPRYYIYGSNIFDTQTEADSYVSNLLTTNPDYVATVQESNKRFSDYKNKFFDIYEFSTEQNDLISNVNITDNNAVFPSYDNFVVQSQGLSGNIKSTLFENGILYGLSDMDNNENYSLNYYSLQNDDNTTSSTKFDGKPYFMFENEVSTYINVNKAILNNNLSNDYILNYYQSGVNINSEPRIKTSNYIEYYTNKQINTNYNFIKEKGYLNPQASGFDRTNLPDNSIGGFKITAIDGKTYHYSLPVYNHETITRTFGTITDRPNEHESYFEKRQFEPYATHWLLTAVTGPDFIDNGDGAAGEGDLGYWTSFEYGKWSDAFVWKAPYKEDYIKDDKKPNIKTWIRGRKQLFYLDKVKTRTHTALFVKSTKEDGASEAWNYQSVVEDGNSASNNNTGSYTTRFSIPSHKQLKLDKIILVRNNKNNVDKTFGQNANSIVNINYNNNYPTYNCPSRGCYMPDFMVNKIETATFNNYNNIIDVNDNLQDVLANSIKVINFNYNYSLVQQDNRLTLKQVEFKGTNNKSILPPYKFEYYNSSIPFNIENQDGWGYLKNDPKAYSLKEITTPVGGKIDINYNNNSFKTLTSHKIEFSTTDGENSVIRYNNQFPHLTTPANLFTIKSSNNYGIQIGDKLDIEYKFIRQSRSGGGNVGYSYDCYEKNYNGSATVIQDLGNNEFLVQFDQNSQHSTCQNNYCPYCISYFKFNLKATYSIPNTKIFTNQGGIRVSEINVLDGVSNFKTEYKYGENEDGIGYVSYIPFVQNLAKELAYSSELPAPRVMYEYVTMSSKNSLQESLGKTRYKFNIMKEKSPDEIKFGDFYEIIKNTVNQNNTAANKTVSISDITIKDNLGSIGQLLEVSQFNNQGQLLSKINNNYYNPSDIIPNNMGVKQESYQTYKTIDYKNNTSSLLDKWVINSSTRITYPTILKSSTEQSNGYTYTTEFKDYDLISGVSKEQIHISSDGKILKTKIVPAYLKYPGMGSKVDDINNANMLSQTAATYSYIQDNGVWKETGVGITTWNNEWVYQDLNGTPSDPNLETPKEKIWRKHKNYIWNGVTDSEGIFEGYNSATDDGFNWTVGVGTVQPNQWKQISEVTLYDHYSMPLEVQDINGNKAATKMDVFNEKVQTTGNAGYNEMYYSGAEEIIHNFYLGQEVRLENGTRSDAFAHTGKYSVATTQNSKFGVFMYVNHRPTRYKITVWAHKNNYQKARLRWFDNNPANTFEFNGEKYFAGDWVQLNHYVDAAYMNLNNTAAFWHVNSIDNTTVYFDDLMIRPIASSITGYVYNENDELTEIISNNGLATRFEYDKAGRLVKTYVEILDDTANGLTGGFKLSAKNKINYRK